MKKILIILSMICCVTIGIARDYSFDYTYKAIKAEGCNVKYTLSKQENQYRLIVSVTSDRMLFTSDPEIKIRTFDDEVIELHGTQLANGSSTVGIMVGAVMVPVTDIITSAEFLVDASTLEKLQIGVKKIRIVLSPMNHEREFTRDKIGKKLYKFYEELKNESDEF